MLFTITTNSILTMDLNFYSEFNVDLNGNPVLNMDLNAC